MIAGVRHGPVNVRRLPNNSTCQSTYFYCQLVRDALRCYGATTETLGRLIIKSHISIAQTCMHILDVVSSGTNLPILLLQTRSQCS